MKRVRFEEHHGRSILVLDFKNCHPAEVLETIAEARRVVSSQPPKSLLVLTDVTDVHYNRDCAKALKLLARDDDPFVRASAVVGVTGLKKVIYQAVLSFSGRDIRMFETGLQAKDWLSRVPQSVRLEQLDPAI